MAVSIQCRLIDEFEMNMLVLKQPLEHHSSKTDGVMMVLEQGDHRRYIVKDSREKSRRTGRMYATKLVRKLVESFGMALTKEISTEKFFCNFESFHHAGRSKKH
jgi:hypothetical protein